MTDAPERIWAFRTADFIAGIECGSWTEIEAAKGSTLFIRADLTPSPEVVKELVEAAKAFRHAVCGDTGFAAAVRLHSGNAYPWPSLDLADEWLTAVLAKLEGGE